MFIGSSTMFDIQNIGDQISSVDATIYSVSSLWACGVSLAFGIATSLYIVYEGKRSKIRENLLTANRLHLGLSMSSDIGFIAQHIFRLATSDRLETCGTLCAIFGYLPMICMAQVPWIVVINYIAASNALATPNSKLVTKTQVVGLFTVVVLGYAASLLAILLTSNTVASYRGMYWASCYLTTGTLWGFILGPIIIATVALIGIYAHVWNTQQKMAAMSKSNTAKEIGRKILERGAVVIGIFLLSWVPMGIDFTIIGSGSMTPYSYSLFTAQLAKMQTALLSLQILYGMVRRGSSRSDGGSERGSGHLERSSASNPSPAHTPQGKRRTLRGNSASNTGGVTSNPVDNKVANGRDPSEAESELPRPIHFTVSEVESEAIRVQV